MTNNSIHLEIAIIFKFKFISDIYFYQEDDGDDADGGKDVLNSLLRYNKLEIFVEFRLYFNKY